MRILHTSDWHLGRSFHRVDLLQAQAAMLDHLVEVVRSERVDAVVVAGDVYDRALPAVDVVKVLDDALFRLSHAGAAVILSSGNHDSAIRLGFNSRVAERAGVHLRTDPARVAEPVVLEDRHGPVAVYPLPYLEPAVTAAAFGIDAPRGAAGHEAVLSAAMTEVRHDLAQRPAGTRSVVAAHAFVVGGEPSDSERELVTGGVSSVPLGVFAGVDYAALGHLHGRQHLAETVRYSGSPLPYSFSEAGHVKGHWLVDLDASGVVAVEKVDTPGVRPLARLAGHLETLLEDPALTRHEGAYVQATLTDAQRPKDAMLQLRTRFPHAVELRFEPEGAVAAGISYTARVAGREDVDVCCGFLEHVRGRDPQADEVELMREALEAVRLADVEITLPRAAVDGVAAAERR